MFAASEHVPHLLKLSPKLPTLKMIISMDEASDDARRVLADWGKTRDIKIMAIEERESLLLILPGHRVSH